MIEPKIIGGNGRLKDAVSGLKNDEIYDQKSYPGITWLFPKLSTQKSGKLKITKESVYSTSTPGQMRDIIQLSKKILGDDLGKLTVTDATANVGGSTIGFAQNFGAVNSVEIDPKTFDLLKNNVELFPNSDRVIFYNDDYLKLIPDLKQDLVFVDPPWGGIDYKSKDKISLKLGDKTMAEITDSLRGRAQCVIFKLPKNFDMSQFDEKKYKITGTETKHFLLVALCLDPLSKPIIS